MVVPIPAGTEFSYNGFTFPVYVKTKLTEKPLTSSDNRFVKCSEVTISASGWLTQADVDFFSSGQNPVVAVGAPLDAYMQALRRQLQVNGKRLAYSNRGYGANLIVNDPAGIYDVQMGPKPGIFVWRSLGGAPDGVHGAAFEWSVTTYIAECLSFSNNPGPKVFLEVSFTVNYQTSELGIVTITTNGTAQIPSSLRGVNMPIATIDDSIGSIIKPPPVGFLRTMSRQISQDRASCTFTITDTQQEVPPPIGVVKIEMHERFRQEKQYSPNWTCSISGTVRMDPLANKQNAWRQFFNIASQRITASRTRASQNMFSTGVSGNVVANQYFNKKPNVVMGIIEFSENLFANESQFTISWKLMGAPFEEIMYLSGMWRPIVGSAGAFGDANGPVPEMDYPWNAETWTASLQGNFTVGGPGQRGGAQKTKGYLGASFDSSTDILINVCTGDAPATGGLGAAPEEDIDLDEALEGDDESDIDDDLEEDSPDGLFASVSVAGAYDEDLSDLFPPETSWLAYECVPERFVDHNQIRHKPLSGTVTYQTPAVDPLGTAGALMEDTSDPTFGFTATAADIVQQTAAPSIWIQLKGFGVRVAYRVNAPKLISYGGLTAVLQYERVTEKTLGYQEAVIYRTDWDLVYLIAAPPSSVPLPANPMLGLDGLVADASSGPTTAGGLTLVP